MIGVKHFCFSYRNGYREYTLVLKHPTFRYHYNKNVTNLKEKSNLPISPKERRKQNKYRKEF